MLGGQLATDWVFFFPFCKGAPLLFMWLNIVMQGKRHVLTILLNLCERCREILLRQVHGLRIAACVTICVGLFFNSADCSPANNSMFKKTLSAERTLADGLEF